MAALNDWQAYLAANPDLAAAGITDAAGAQAHYDQYGAAEGRQNVGGAAPAPAAPAAGPADQYGITADQYRTYFSGNHSQADINAAAKYLGLNQGQLAALESQYGYSGIITQQGVNLTNDQIKQFYGSGVGSTPFSQGLADDTQAAKTLGLDNEAVQNARRIAGGIGIYTDPGQYDQYAIWMKEQLANPNRPNPYGTGGFDEWRAGQSPADLAKWKTGSYSPNSGVAYDPRGAASSGSGSVNNGGMGYGSGTPTTGGTGSGTGGTGTGTPGPLTGTWTPQPTGGVGTVYQPGQTTGAAPVGQGQPFSWGPAPAQTYNTPVLDALYQGQQQHMQAIAPQFNFQAKPADPAQPGALTQAITG